MNIHPPQPKGLQLFGHKLVAANITRAKFRLDRNKPVHEIS